MSSIAAVVVTYNRVGMLSNLVLRLGAQSHTPDWLIVVNNNSSDGTREFLETVETAPGLTVLTMAENLGGAGGFNVGMRKAFDLGADFIWVMDDDCLPQEDALENLISGFSAAQSVTAEPIPFACSAILHPDGRPVVGLRPVPALDWFDPLVSGQSFAFVKQCSFVSAIFTRLTLETYGLPFKEYFIWGDDAEYTARITARKSGILVPSSQVLDIAEDPLHGEDPIPFINTRNAWKHAFRVRNEASRARLDHGRVGWLRYLLMTAKRMRDERVTIPLQLRMIVSAIRGYRFDPAVEYPGTPASASSGT